jgi:NO-binding membrane sensor protein with MHYT domain
VTEVNLFTYGWVIPALAFVMATSGFLLAIVLVKKARGRAGRSRGRLLGYATVALGGIGIFQTHFLALLGFSAKGVTLRYHPLTLLEGLGVAILAVGAGLCLAGFGRSGPTRLVSATTLIGAGAAAAHHICVSGMRGAGDLYYEPTQLVGSAVIGVLVAGLITRLILFPRGMRSAVVAASIAGAGMCGMHYLAITALRAQPGPLVAVDATLPAAGLTPMVLTGPAVLLGAAVTAMLWYFTLGASTVDDLRAIFEHPEDSVEIEPWLIAEVTRRVALDYYPPSAGMRIGDDPTAPGSAASRVTANEAAPPNPSFAVTAPVAIADRTAATNRIVAANGTAGAMVNATHAARHPVPGALASPRSTSELESAAPPRWVGQGLTGSSEDWNEPNAGPARLPVAPDRYPPAYNRTKHNTAPSP